MQTEAELEHAFSSALNCRIALCICGKEIEESALTDEEKNSFTAMKHERRRSSWLKGRAALKSISLRTGWQKMISGNPAPKPVLDHQVFSKEQLQSVDTAQIKMPHARVSLTHSDRIAIAALTLDSSRGIGVDLEGGRPVQLASARFFLSEDEQCWLNDLMVIHQPEALLRLWTVKEALFKADLNNEGKTLSQYVLVNPESENGMAMTAEWPEPRYFKYCSIKVDEYWLTVALPAEGASNVQQT